MVSAPTAGTGKKAGDFVNVHAKYFTDKQWFALPLALRKRWWSETNYNEVEPSAELLAKIRAKLER
jgi:hypothetical protein